MIEVHIHGNNAIYLKGACLNGAQRSTIAIHRHNWEITLSLLGNRPLQRVQVATKAEVIPALRAILDNWHITEDIHPEVQRHVDIVYSEFGPGGKYDINRDEHGRDTYQQLRDLAAKYNVEILFPKAPAPNATVAVEIQYGHGQVVHENLPVFIDVNEVLQRHGETVRIVYQKQRETLWEKR